jgi:hypothetical protein
MAFPKKSRFPFIVYFILTHRPKHWLAPQKHRYAYLTDAFNQSWAAAYVPSILRRPLSEIVALLHSTATFFALCPLAAVNHYPIRQYMVNSNCFVRIREVKWSILVLQRTQSMAKADKLPKTGLKARFKQPERQSLLALNEPDTPESHNGLSNFLG